MPKEDGKWNVGIEFQLNTIAYAAACLSENVDVEDFETYTNQDDVPGFDDIIIKVKYKSEAKPFVYLGQIKHVTKKINFKGKKHSITDYLRFIVDITRKKEQNRFLKGLFQDVPDENIQYWYYSNSFFHGPLTQPIVLDDDIICYIESATSNKSVFSETDTTDCYKLNPRDSDQYSNELEKFRFLLNQPDCHKISQCIVNLNSDMFSTETANKIINYVHEYLKVPTNKKLTKHVFETELLKLCLSSFIVSPTTAFQINPELANMWNELVLQYDVTVIDNTSMEMKPYIFGCVWQRLKDLYDCDFDWNKCITDLGKIKIARDQNKFIELTRAKKCRYWLFKPDTLDALLVEMWKCDYLPLVLTSDTGSTILNKYKHLRKKNIVLDTEGKIYDEVSLLDFRVFANAAVIHEVELGKEFLKKIFISLQGREPVDIFSIVNGDTVLMKELKCCHILHLIKKRNISFDEETISEVNSIASDDSNAINQIKANSVDINENVINYKTFSLRRFAIDQNGDDLYLQNDRVVPIIGQKLENCANYISRCLRKPTLEESIFNSEEKVICILTGNLDSSYWLTNNELEIIDGPVDHIVSKIEVQVEKKENAFVATEDRHVKELWSKISPQEHSLLHIKVENGAMLLSKYHNCKNIGTYISYKGSIFDEQSFFRETSVGITLITGNPGMGKSTLLRSLFNACDKHNYALLCDLKDYQVDIGERNTQLFDDPINFILNREAKQLTLCNHRHSLCHVYLQFVQKFLERTREIVLFLDSFDEILPKCEEPVLDFIKVLDKPNNVRLIVASRLVTANVLINSIEVKPMKMESLHPDDVKKYITKDKLAEQQFDQFPQEFRNNPMYLNFVISLFQDNSLPATMTKSTLYDAIIKQHIKRYFERKVDFYASTQYENVRKDIVDIHKSLALVEVFDSGIVQNLGLDYKQLMKECTDTDKLKLGLILRFNVDRPVFIHRTFADFFIAEWLSENIDQDFVKRFYVSLLKGSLVHIIRFADEILCEHLELHKAVLAEDLALVESLCTADSNHLREVDKLNRTALHLASTGSKTGTEEQMLRILETIVRYMKTNEMDFSCRDSIKEWTWADYLNIYLLYRVNNINLTVTIEMYFLCVNSIKEGIKWSMKWGRLDAVMALLKRDIRFLPAYFYDFASDLIRKARFDIFCELIELRNRDNVEFNILYKTCKNLSPSTPSLDCLNLKMVGGFTALHIACIYGNVKTVEDLLKLGANVTASDTFKREPLCYAVFQGFAEIVSLIVEHKKTTEEVVKKSSITKLFMKKLSFLSRPHHRKKNLFLFIYLEFCIKMNFLETAKIFLENGFDINQTDDGGRTVLHTVLINIFRKRHMSYVDDDNDNNKNNDDIDKVKFLLKYNPNCNIWDNKGNTPLKIAVKNNDWHISHMLLQYGATAGTCASLDIATENGNAEIAKLLLEFGADVNNADGFSLLQTAIITGYCSKKTPYNTENFVEIFLSYGANVNATCIGGNTALHIATKYKRVKVITILMENGADVNYRNRRGFTALHTAISKGHAGIVKMLVARGASVDAENEDGDTPLFIAVKTPSPELISLLLETGANVNYANKIANTALHLAVRNKRADIAKILLDHGADINAVNEYRQTALFFANQYQNMSAIELLLNYKTVND